MLERLHKLLARAGVAALRPSEDLILQGHVTVNGKIVRELGARADPDTDVIAVDGQVINIPPPGGTHRYIMLHKPRGVISTAQDTHDRPTVVQLVPSDVRVFPVGRLDADSEGLLLLTDDGDLGYRLTHPRFEVEKEYRVLVDRVPTLAELRRWRLGVELDEGQMTGRAWVEVHERGADGVWLRVVMNEGRKRQIREIARLLGLEVQRLIRVREGSLVLGALPPGAWRELTEAEVAALRAHTQHVPSREADEERERSMSEDEERRPRRLRVVRRSPHADESPRREDQPEGSRSVPTHRAMGPAEGAEERTPRQPRGFGERTQSGEGRQGRPPRGEDAAARPEERRPSEGNRWSEGQRGGAGRGDAPGPPYQRGPGGPPRSGFGRPQGEGGRYGGDQGRGGPRSFGPRRDERPRDDRRGFDDRRNERPRDDRRGFDDRRNERPRDDRRGFDDRRSFGQRGEGGNERGRGGSGGGNTTRGNLRGGLGGGRPTGGGGGRWNDRGPRDRGQERGEDAPERNGNIREEGPPSRGPRASFGGPPRRGPGTGGPAQGRGRPGPGGGGGPRGFGRREEGRGPARGFGRREEAGGARGFGQREDRGGPPREFGRREDRGGPPRDFGRREEGGPPREFGRREEGGGPRRPGARVSGPARGRSGPGARGRGPAGGGRGPGTRSAGPARGRGTGPRNSPRPGGRPGSSQRPGPRRRRDEE